MPPMFSSFIACEIVADAAITPALSAIARACAGDLGRGLAVWTRFAPETEPTITFRFTPTAVLAQDVAWRLAGRVACFCPQARVGIAIGPEQRAEARKGEDAA